EPYLWTPFDGERFGQLEHAGTRGGSVSDSGEATSDHGDDICDTAAVAVEHLAADHLCHVPGASKVGVDDGVPALRRKIAGSLRILPAGVVDEHIDASEGLLGEGTQRFNRVALANVDWMYFDPAPGRCTDLGRCLFENLHAARGKQEVGTGLRQCI